MEGEHAQGVLWRALHLPSPGTSCFPLLPATSRHLFATICHTAFGGDAWGLVSGWRELLLYLARLFLAAGLVVIRNIFGLVCQCCSGLLVFNTVVGRAVHAGMTAPALLCPILFMDVVHCGCSCLLFFLLGVCSHPIPWCSGLIFRRYKKNGKTVPRLFAVKP